MTPELHALIGRAYANFMNFKALRPIASGDPLFRLGLEQLSEALDLIAKQTTGDKHDRSEDSPSAG